MNHEQEKARRIVGSLTLFFGAVTIALGMYSITTGTLFEIFVYLGLAVVFSVIFLWIRGRVVEAYRRDREGSDE